jgi:hypothetical protein
MKIIYRFLTIYAKNSASTHIYQRRRNQPKSRQALSCELLKGGNNISKYEAHNGREQQKNFLLRFFSSSVVSIENKSRNNGEKGSMSMLDNRW